MSLVRFRPEAPSPARFSCGGPKCECSSSGRAPPCQGGGSEFEPRHSLHQRSKVLFAPCLIRCHSQVVRQSSAKAPLPSSNLGGTSKKKDTLKSVSFFLGFGSQRLPPPFGDLNARGRQSRPCAILRCAPNLRRTRGAAQKGQFTDPVASILCGQDRKKDTLKGYSS